MDENSEVEAEPFEVSEVPERALRVYARLWQFETWLRQMVYVELRAKAGDNWSAGLGANNKALEADKALKHMPTPEMNALSYSSLSKLAAMVKDNWECFEPYLPPQQLWESKLLEVSQIRHRVAHFRVGHSDDYGRLRQFLRDVDHGFWEFCTSYNRARPVLPQSDDALTAHFLSLDPLPWGEMEPKHWARIGRVNRDPVIGLTVEALRRPWAPVSHAVDGQIGYLYDMRFTANDRLFDYRAVLESTRHLHQHFCHVVLDHFENSLRLTVPTLLGSAQVIGLTEEFLELAKYAVGRSRNPIAPSPEVLAAEWPEYVLGPDNPLSFLGPDMKASFFSA